MESIEFDWPDFWDNDQSPKILIVVRVSDPTVPSYKQVQLIQDLINDKMSGDYRGLKFQIRVQRINVTEVSGEDMPSTRSVDDILIDPIQPSDLPDLPDLPVTPIDPNWNSNEGDLTNENGKDLKPEPLADVIP